MHGVVMEIEVFKMFGAGGHTVALYTVEGRG